MKKRSLKVQSSTCALFVVGVCIVGGASFVAHDASAAKDISMAPASVAAVLSVLESRQFLKLATCHEFTDVILHSAGLPLLGETAVFAGKAQRMNVNRSEDKQATPNITDGIQTIKGPYRSIAIVTKRGKGGLWSLQLTREWDDNKQRQHSDTTYEFETRAPSKDSISDATVASGLSICDLVRVDYRSRASKGEVLSMNGNSCLTISKSKFDTSKFSTAQTNSLTFLKHDCSVGVAFFKDLKLQLNEASKRSPASQSRATNNSAPRTPTNSAPRTPTNSAPRTSTNSAPRTATPVLTDKTQRK